MPAKRPPYVAGGFYHFYNRGAHRVSLFREEDNYLFVLRKMKTYCRSLELTMIAYCLLPNHYHWLVQQDGEGPAGLLPQRVFNAYSKAYNKRYDHSGTLFEGNYKVKAVKVEPYVLHLCRYIHANPVIHGLAEDVGDWPYSNYAEWVSDRNGALADEEFVRAHFPVAEQYRAFVSQWVEDRRMPSALAMYLRSWEG